jgi:hypothetical protein
MKLFHSTRTQWHGAPHSRRSKLHRGQALVELAIVLPILLVLTGGIIQLGAVMATQHTLIQIGRDVGRWAATQGTDPCTDLAAVENQPAIRADEIARESGLMGYVPGTWTSNFISYGSGPMPAAATAPGLEVAWELDVNGDCPPIDSTTAAFVTVRLAHDTPVLLPGFDLVFAQLPGLGTCSGGTCRMLSTTTAQFRMEPEADPAVTTP